MIAVPLGTRDHFFPFRAFSRTKGSRGVAHEVSEIIWRSVALGRAWGSGIEGILQMQNSEIVSRGTKRRSAFMIKAMAGLMAVAMIAAGCGSDDEAAPVFYTPLTLPTKA